MSRLFLIPVINIFEVHDSVVKDWLIKLDDGSIRQYLKDPFKLGRYFPENGRRALTGAEKVHRELLVLLDMIDPQAVFLDVPIDLCKLENKYNKRLLSPQEFWMEYHETVSGDMTGDARELYMIYIKEVIDKNIRLLESKDGLPLSIVFYGIDTRSREVIIPVYEDVFEKDGKFLLHAARAANEIINFRQKPRHLWYSPLKIRQMAISYEETEKFYDEFLNRMKRLLEFKVRDHFVKSLGDVAGDLAASYEKFLDHKLKEDDIIISNIIEGLNMLSSQAGDIRVVILCEPIHYAALYDFFRNKKELAPGFEKKYLKAIMEALKPFVQKYRIMQSDYDIALNILGSERPKKYATSGAILVPQ